MCVEERGGWGGERVDERKEGLKQKSKGGEREGIMMSPLTHPLVSMETKEPIEWPC